MWDVETGALEATLREHGDTVYSLVVHGDRLFSGSYDGTIREWAAGTWAALRTVAASEAGVRQFPKCLAVSGSKLVRGPGDARVRAQGAAAGRGTGLVLEVGGRRGVGWSGQRGGGHGVGA